MNGYTQWTYPDTLVTLVRCGCDADCVSSSQAFKILFRDLEVRRNGKRELVHHLIYSTDLDAG